MDPRRKLRALPTDVYRVYDAADRLLYVGISADVFTRLRSHRYTSPWYRTASTVRIEQYSDWRTARHVEGRAIDQERPIHNGMRTWWSKDAHPEPLEVIEVTVTELAEFR